MPLTPRIAIRPSSDDLARWQASYRRRKVARLTSIAGWALAVVSGVVFALNTTRWYMAVLVGVWILYAIAGIAFWRCPRCGEQFGNAWRVGTCPHCFLQLE
jgi:hypothetical protein